MDSHNRPINDGLMQSYVELLLFCRKVTIGKYISYLFKIVTLFNLANLLQKGITYKLPVTFNKK